ncbi:MAG: DUF4124 domain-containing protein [Gammaproteobacteria bacterium]
MKSAALIVVGCTLFAATTLAGVYKWTDNEGNVHYTDTPPSGVPAQSLKSDPAPPLEDADKARARLEAMTKTVQMGEQKRARATEINRLRRLGPLPPNESSEFLETIGSGVLYHWDDKAVTAKFAISVRVKPTVPYMTAYIEAHFEHPSTPGTPMVDSQLWRWGTKELSFSSAPVTGLKCWHYTVTIKVCHWHGCEQKKHDVKSNVLGIHRQRIQNRIDTGKLRSQAQLVEAINDKGGFCP